MYRCEANRNIICILQFKVNQEWLENPTFSLACDISAMPGINCTFLAHLSKNIGAINFDKDRPTAHARIKVSKFLMN